MKNRPSRVSPEEELLFARCLKQEPEAIRELGRRYALPLYGLLQSLCGKKAESLDPLVIEVFADALKSGEPFALQEPLAVTLTRSLLEKIQKKIRRKKISVSTELADSFDPKLRLLFKALSGLSWNQKFLLLLRDQLLLSHEEIAGILTLPKAQVPNRLKEARLLFRKNLQEFLEPKKGRA